MIGSIAASSLLLDREFLSALSTLDAQIDSRKPLPVALNGLTGGTMNASALLLAERAAASRGVLLLLAENERVCRALAAFLTENGVRAAAYPYRDMIMHPVVASHEHDRERLSVLSGILEGRLDTVITTPSALLQYTVPRSRLAERALLLDARTVIDPSVLCEKLTALGYKRSDTTEAAGQFSARGGIIDLFVHEEGLPVRIEFFGDEIDRMCYFDPATQRAGEPCESVQLLPALEVILDGEAQQTVRARIEKMLRYKKDMQSASVLREELALLEAGIALPDADKYIAAAYETQESLLSYLEARAEGSRVRVALLGTAGVEEQLEASLGIQREELSALVQGGFVWGEWASYSGTETDYRRFLERSAVLHMNVFAGVKSGTRLSGLFGVQVRRGNAYSEHRALLVEDVTALSRSGYRMLLLAGSSYAQSGVIASLNAGGVTAVAIDQGVRFDDMKAGIVYVSEGDFPGGGFELISARCAVLSLQEGEAQATLRKKKKERAKRFASSAGEKILSYAELKVGDFVVHETHGIGQFVGMETLRIDGVLREYITIRYAGSDKLFLPAERLEAISKFIGGGEEGTVKLSRIGGGDWQKAKQRAKHSAEEMAKELIELYATRMRKKGHAFPPDSSLEKDFDADFPFEETDSQLAAIEDIKEDMMKSVPMDRLLCGDVGYGKTEVALRAAFKAVVGGKQVAILVPTTILALQHYQTVQSRMRGYAVSAEMLSRFRRPKERAEIIRRLARGDLDIIIGTHSLLSKQVSFKNLGLLIVDEEQRFGVGQKEKIKQLAKDVDVLTLTATPIPRTLNMAMSGIRDMSLLDEAPGGRYPVQSYVLEHNDAIIAEAIRREISRGGQVLYLYNRTESIGQVADRIARQCEGARVVYAHGQMEKEALEDIWQEMVSGEIDVLVCTTIIETGVDLPNANTLIIEDADRLGLSQLHQLRGRVGRSGRHAYAYFTYRQGKALTEIATKRLDAIREYAGFGAGFRVALRDLEIRGAGNLLGAEQHGHIDAVGYDLYIRLLNEAILTEKGEALPPPFEAKVKFDGDAHIPDRYIAASAQRMEMYKKISLIGTAEDRSDVLDEFCDRFGDVPECTMRLLDAALARALAARAQIERVEQRGDELYFVSEKPAVGIWSELFAKHGTLRFGGGAIAGIHCRIPKNERDGASYAVQILTDYLEILDEIRKEETNN